MIYEFVIKEIRKAVVPVRAANSDKAQEIFDEWYEKHDNDPTDSTIYDMLDNGYEDKFVTMHVGIEESKYNPRDILLPEEKPEPQEPKYDMHIRFADGSQPITHFDMTLKEVGQILMEMGDEYYLFPDAGEEWGLITDGKLNPRENKNMAFWIYAVRTLPVRGLRPKNLL